MTILRSLKSLVSILRWHKSFSLVVLLVKCAEQLHYHHQSLYNVNQLDA